MTHRLILASGSKIRQKLLLDAAISYSIVVDEIDEPTLRSRLQRENATSKMIAEALAQQKAIKVSHGHQDAFVIGCDQVLAFEGTVFSKPKNIDQARHQLTQLRGQTHMLYSSVSIVQNGKEIWAFTGQVALTMRTFTDDYLERYLARNWPSICHSVGGYKLEEEGIRLFSAIEGDYFTVLGMPLLALLNYLTQCGEIEQ